MEITGVIPACTSSLKHQYLSAVIVNLQTIAIGLQEGWPSPAVLLLTSKDSPLRSGPISMEEASWVASLYSLGLLFGTTIFQFSMDKFGRKLLLMAIVIPSILMWLLIWFAQNVYYLYTARFIGGSLAGGGYVALVVFLSDISNDNIRGMLVSTMILNEMIGALLGCVIGSLFEFYATPLFAIVLLIIFTISMYFLPETPLFLMKQNRISEAEVSIRFYNNLYGAKNQKMLDFEVDKLKQMLNNGMNTNKKISSIWSDITSGVGRKSMIFGIVLEVINTFSGFFAISNYASKIFADTGSNLSPNMSAIIVLGVQVLGTFTGTYLADRLGRKILLAASNIGTALGLTVLGIYTMLQSLGYHVEVFNWIPLVSLCCTNFTSMLGVQTITLTVITEIMPAHMKEICVSLCLQIQAIFLFLNTKFLPTVSDLIGFHGSMFIYAGVSLFGALFTILCLVETNGKSHQEIMKSLQRSKKW